MIFADSHCHLDFSKFHTIFNTAVDDQYAVNLIIERAKLADVQYMLTVGTALDDLESTKEIIENHDTVFRTVGIHPLEAKNLHSTYEITDAMRLLEKHTVLKKTVAIGEIGLDYHYEQENQKQQHELFHSQLDLAKKLNLPVVVHSRDAWSDIIDVLREHHGVIGVIHCFSGEKQFAQKALDLGFFISISGVITYKKSTELQETAKYIPQNRLLIETDSPFLSPVPYRSKINEPSMLLFTAEKLAQVLDMQTEDIAQITTTNFLQLFQVLRYL